MFCPRCGTQLPDDAQFCGSCGTRLATPAAPAAKATPVAVSVPIPASAATTPSGGAAAAAPKGVSKRAVAIGLVAVIVIAAVVVAGMLTSWFGLAKDKSAYVVTKTTTYYTDEGAMGIVSGVTENMLDAHGNVASSTLTAYGWSKSKDEPVETHLSGTQTTTYTRDNHGYLTHSESQKVLKDGLVVSERSVDYENSYDSNGKNTLQRYKGTEEQPDASGGDSATQTTENTTTLEYHQNGCVKSSTQASKYTYENWPNNTYPNDGTLNYVSDANYISEYDENGYILHSETKQSNINDSGDTYESTVDFAWEFDLAGKPTACTVTLNNWYYNNGSSKKYTFDTDDAGNITVVYDPDGNKVVEYEYKRIEDPSDAVRNRTITIPWSF